MWKWNTVPKPDKSQTFDHHLTCLVFAKPFSSSTSLRNMGKAYCSTFVVFATLLLISAPTDHKCSGKKFEKRVRLHDECREQGISKNNLSDLRGPIITFITYHTIYNRTKRKNQPKNIHQAAMHPTAEFYTSR